MYCTCIPDKYIQTLKNLSFSSIFHIKCPCPSKQFLTLSLTAQSGKISCKGVQENKN